MSNSRIGIFGSTQATFLALKSITKFNEVNFPDIQKLNKEIKFDLNLILDDQVIETVSFPNFFESYRSTSALKFEDFSDKINKEKKIVEHSMEISCSFSPSFEYNIQIPYSISFEYFVEKPETIKDSIVDFCNLSFIDSKSTEYHQMFEGEIDSIELKFENKTDKSQSMTTCVIGLPAGIEPVYERLDELMKTNQISFFELIGSTKLVFYWDFLLPNEVKVVKFEVIAQIPGKFSGIASCVYLYYSNWKSWFEPLKVEIKKKD